MSHDETTKAILKDFYRALRPRQDVPSAPDAATGIQRGLPGFEDAPAAPAPPRPPQLPTDPSGRHCARCTEVVGFTSPLSYARLGPYFVHLVCCTLADLESDGFMLMEGPHGLQSHETARLLHQQLEERAQGRSEHWGRGVVGKNTLKVIERLSQGLPPERRIQTPFTKLVMGIDWGYDDVAVVSAMRIQRQLNKTEAAVRATLTEFLGEKVSPELQKDMAKRLNALFLKDLSPDPVAWSMAAETPYAKAGADYIRQRLNEPSPIHAFMVECTNELPPHPGPPANPLVGINDIVHGGFDDLEPAYYTGPSLHPRPEDIAATSKMMREAIEKLAGAVKKGNDALAGVAFGPLGRITIQEDATLAPGLVAVRDTITGKVVRALVPGVVYPEGITIGPNETLEEIHEGHLRYLGPPLPSLPSEAIEPLRIVGPVDPVMAAEWRAKLKALMDDWAKNPHSIVLPQQEQDDRLFIAETTRRMADGGNPFMSIGRDWLPAPKDESSEAYCKRINAKTQTSFPGPRGLDPNDKRKVTVDEDGTVFIPCGRALPKSTTIVSMGARAPEPVCGATGQSPCSPNCGHVEHGSSGKTLEATGGWTMPEPAEKTLEHHMWQRWNAIEDTARARYKATHGPCWVTAPRCNIDGVHLRWNTAPNDPVGPPDITIPMGFIHSHHERLIGRIVHRERPTNGERFLLFRLIDSDGDTALLYTEDGRTLLGVVHLAGQDDEVVVYQGRTNGSAPKYEDQFDNYRLERKLKYPKYAGDMRRALCGRYDSRVSVERCQLDLGHGGDHKSSIASWPQTLRNTAATFHIETEAGKPADVGFFGATPRPRPRPTPPTIHQLDGHMESECEGCNTGLLYDDELHMHVSLNPAEGHEPCFEENRERSETWGKNRRAEAAGEKMGKWLAEAFVGELEKFGPLKSSQHGELKVPFYKVDMSVPPGPEMQAQHRKNLATVAHLRCRSFGEAMRVVGLAAAYEQQALAYSGLTVREFREAQVFTAVSQLEEYFGLYPTK